MSCVGNVEVEKLYEMDSEVPLILETNTFNRHQISVHICLGHKILGTYAHVCKVSLMRTCTYKYTDL